jgi:membrane-associated phospholipid phosphatase
MLGTLSLPRFLRASSFEGNSSSEDAKTGRIQAALKLRTDAAFAQSSRALAGMKSNGDEDSLPNRIACYSKGLPHNQYGEVEPAAYNGLLAAINSGKFSDFERIPRGGGRRLSNPQSAYAFHMEGGDPHTFDIPLAPSIGGEEIRFDAAELYWQAICRDIPFAEYAKSAVIDEAAKDLGVPPQRIFRGPTSGDAAGPYISQFLLKPIPYGAGKIEQRYSVPIAGSDFMTSIGEWSQIQTGFLPWLSATYQAAPRYIVTGRDLAEYVHYDFAYQAYLGAALILVNANAKSILNCNQFKSGNNPYRFSTIEEGFATFGPAEAADWLGRVTTAALKAAYCQKWMVHRRLRPEALGGLIHQTLTGTRKYPIHQTVLENAGVQAVFKRTGTYLLPQAYPEGCPTHPSYPSGHAAIAGACSVILKACFDGTMLLPGCVEPGADGLALQPCHDYAPTVNDEIDKLAFNIAMGRDWAGIHYRSDTNAGLILGESVGISILQDLARTYSEEFNGFTIRQFDGATIRITPGGQVVKDQG